MPKITFLIALLLLSTITQQVGLRTKKSFTTKNCIKKETAFDGTEVCVECREGFVLSNKKFINGTCERFHKAPENTIGNRFNETSLNSSFLQTELKNDPDVRYNKINSKPYITGYSIRGGSKYMAGSDAPNILNTVGDKLVDNIKYNHDDPPYMYDKPPIVELGMLTAQIAAGGRIARKALLRLNTLANHVGMDKYIRSFLPIALACKSLIIREQEDVNVKMLCGSLYSRITDTPVTTQYADISNGTDYGKVSTIVMPRPSRIYRPDKEVQKLREGADLLHILDDKPLEYYDD